MSQTDAEEMKQASFITSSSYRIAVVNELLDGPSIPSKIAESADLDVAHASRALRELQEEGVTELCVPEGTKKGRIYRLAEDAGKAVKIVESINE